jgi:hypothetical protein
MDPYLVTAEEMYLLEEVLVQELQQLQMLPLFHYCFSPLILSNAEVLGNVKQ